MTGKLPDNRVLLDLWEQGCTQTEIAAMYGVTRQAVSQRLSYRSQKRAYRPPPKMTATRRAILEAIVAYKRANDGNSPTVRELSETVGRAYCVVHQHLRVLERMGRIRLLGEWGQARRICVVGGRWELEGDDVADENAAR